MKYQCGFCKSEEVETLCWDRVVIVMCQVCNMESIVKYPETMNYFSSEGKEEYPPTYGLSCK